MSNLVYPTLPGLTLEVQRDVIAPPVTIKTTPSRREFRARDATRPLYYYAMKYEFLRSVVPFNELQALVGFYNQVGGSFDSFLYTDADDCTATNEGFGVGDGATTVWQLLRGFGGFAEGVDATRSGVAVTMAGVNLNLLQQANAFGTAPWAGLAVVTANTDANPVDGAVDADTVTDNSASSALARTQRVSLADAPELATDQSTYTASIYVKKTSGGTSKTVRLLLQFDTGGTTAAYDMRVNTDTGAVLSSTAGTSALVGDGGTFWRLSLSGANNGSGNTSAAFIVYPSHCAYGSSVGDVTQQGSAVLWGAKLEAGSSLTGATSTFYVVSPTSGTVTITPAPPVGAGLSWSGRFYRRCRFAGAKLSTAKFMQRLYAAGKVEIQSVLDE
jgi:hypothetical protein